MSAYALRPRSPGELLDAAFQLYRAHFVPVVLATAICVSPLFLAYLLLPLGLHPIVDRVSGLFYLAAGGAVAFLVSSAVRGAPLDVKESLSAVGARFLSLWGVAIAQGLLVGFGLLLLVVPGLYLLAMTACAIPLVMVEGRRAGEALERSRRLTEGRILAVATVAVPAHLLVILTVLGVEGVLVLASGALVTERVLAVVFELSALLVQPFTAVCATLVYYDLRIRKEALDVEVAADAIAAPAAPAV